MHIVGYCWRVIQLMTQRTIIRATFINVMATVFVIGFLMFPLARTGVCEPTRPSIIASHPVEEVCGRLGKTFFNNSYRLFEGKHVPIVLSVTDDPLHQIVSRMFAFYLHESVGHTNVTLARSIPMESANETCNIYNKLNDVMELESELITKVIDVGFSRPFEEDFYSNFSALYQLGKLGPLRQFEWFYPNLINTLKHKFELKSLAHVRGLPFLQEITPELSTFLPDKKNEYCYNDTLCQPHEYTPDRCTNEIQCVLLLSSYFSETSFVIQQINELNLHVKVVWLGPNLLLAVESLKKAGHMFLFLARNPSEVVVDSTMYNSIQIDHFTGDLSYKQMPMFKYMPYSRKPPVHLTARVEQFRLDQFRALDLLKSLNTKMHSRYEATGHAIDSDKLIQMYNEVACDNIESLFGDTNPVTADMEIKIRIYGLLYNENQTAFDAALFEGIGTVVMRAIADIEKSRMLPSLKLLMEFKSCGCEKSRAINEIMNMVNTRDLLGVLGPACSDPVHSIADMTNAGDIPLITYAAEGGSFADRQTYRNVFRTIGESRQYGVVLTELFRRFEWKEAVALSVQGSKYSEYLGEMNLEFIKDTKKLPIPVTQEKVNEDLEAIRNKGYKIIVADLDGEAVEKVFCEAYHLDMTAKYDYVWFLPDWVAKKWDYNRTRSRHSSIGDCTADQINEALEGHFAMSQQHFAPNSATLPNQQSVGQFLNETKLSTRAREAPSYLGFAYDAVWSFAFALKQCLKDDPEFALHLRSLTHQPIESMERLRKAIGDTQFNGLSGPVSFRKDGSRDTDKFVLRREKAKWIKAYSFVNGKLTEIDSIHWINGHRPTDGSDDYFLRLVCLAGLGILLAVLITLLSCWFYRRKYRKKIEASAILMRSFGLDMRNSKVTSNANGTLKDWEISKDNIRLNFKLGFGMFGVVLGGHVLINEDGDWIPVAAKALRRSSNFEERLDFLTEAETMKRLDHPNIVKLIGVSLACDPIYTIMELMMHGDLRSYLQKRRHLVGRNSDEDNEVSPERLTNMVLDVARGLSYLAQQKFVHRDLASRNCLVTGTGQPIVKLGDFGMARPMFDNDHYKFKRLSRLPIRWSAPESLTDGIYTPASDVWSFGILVYEIITFGACPYQGMSNGDVFERIKSGKSMAIPRSAKPQLGHMLALCWMADFRQRPRACDIVDYVANYAHLVTPCLDVEVDSAHMSILDDAEATMLKFRGAPMAGNRLSGGKEINYLDVSVADCVNDIQEWTGNVEPDEMRSRYEYIEMMHGEYNPIKPLLDKSVRSHANDGKTKNRRSLLGLISTSVRKLFNFRVQQEVTRL